MIGKSLEIPFGDFEGTGAVKLSQEAQNCDKMQIIRPETCVCEKISVPLRSQSAARLKTYGNIGEIMPKTTAINNRKPIKLQLNRWENLFIEFLDMIEFSLHKRIDTDDVECYGVEDLQRANLGEIEQDFFYSASDVLKRMQIYEEDYIVKDILECMSEKGLLCEYNQWSDLLKYRTKLPHNQLGFDFIDMICYHSQDIDIDNVYSFLKVA